MKKLIVILLSIYTCFLPSVSYAKNQIIYYVENGDIEMVKKLIHSRYDIDETNEIDEFNATPLIRATVLNNTQMVQLLLENKASVNKADMGGATALHIASRNGNHDIVKLLLAHGANRDLRDAGDYTPLMRAQENNNNDVVSLLNADKKSATINQPESLRRYPQPVDDVNANRQPAQLQPMRDVPQNDMNANQQFTPPMMRSWNNNMPSKDNQIQNNNQIQNTHNNPTPQGALDLRNKPGLSNVPISTTYQNPMPVERSAEYKSNARHTQNLVTKDPRIIRTPPLTRRLKNPIFMDKKGRIVKNLSRNQ